MKHLALVLFGFALIWTSAFADGAPYAKSRPYQDPKFKETGDKARPDSDTLQGTVPYLRMASWSLTGLGGSYADDRNPASIADVLSRFDIVAVQGISNGDAFAQIMNTLQALTGVEWTIRLEPLSGKGPEAFHEVMTQAILWRTDRVQEKVATASIDTGTTGWMAAPYGGVYTLNGHDFVLISITGVTKLPPGADAVMRAASIAHKLLQSAPLFLAGDYASTSGAPEASILARYMRPLVEGGNTRLKSKLYVASGAKNGLLNNIWTTSISPIRAGVYPFHRVLGQSEESAADTVSTQLPVFAMPQLDLMQGSG